MAVHMDLLAGTDLTIPAVPVELHGYIGPEQGIKLLGLLLTGSTGQHMASRNGLA